MTAIAQAQAPAYPQPRSGTVRRQALLHPAGITAVWRRDLGSLLGNPLGYIFILVFVLISAAAMFWLDGERFFARNISDLGPLIDKMPWILAVLLPALAMGSWAREKEQGTEELLLTLPLSIADALFGKFLAVSSFFTVALACSLSNVIALIWLGSPDPGLVLANYVGWWLAGLGFAAISIFTSTLFSTPLIAFVVGAALCAGVNGIAGLVGWYDDFNRGVVPLVNIVVALGIMALGLGSAALVLASRRWRPGSAGMVWGQVITLVLAVVLAVNLGKIGYSEGFYTDVSVEHLSSLSPISYALIKKLDRPVTITAYISSNIPPELQLKAKEIEDKLSAVSRANSLITVTIKHPEDEFDKAGQEAGREFNLKTRPVETEAASGKQLVNVFLGAAIASAGNTQVIDYFDPGLSVEYEVVRALRSVTQSKKPVLGVVQTDMDMMGGFDFQGGGMTPEWEIVKEWRKQYDVHQVNLDSEVSSEIKVLVVPQPSSLTQPQIEHLHDYIWNGGPTLLLEDPLPVVEMKGELLPSRPKKNPSNPYGGGEEEQGGPKKGDIQPLWKALGLDFPEDKIVTSDYNPSHKFRSQLPNTFLWVDRSQTKDETDNPAMTGIDSLLFIFAGELRTASDKFSMLTVSPLIRATPGYDWSTVPVSEVVQFGYDGRMNLSQASPSMKDVGGLAPTDMPIIAAEITGRMQSAYPEADPDAKPPAGGAAPEKKVGVVSPKPIDVILVADSDCFSAIMFQLYRNPDNRFSGDEMHELTGLRNVELAGNLVDALFGDKSLLDLRTRRPQARPLSRLENVLRGVEDKKQRDEDQAESDAESKLAEIRSQNEKKLSDIDARTDLDEMAKAQLKAERTKADERELAIDMETINLDKNQKIAKAKSEENAAVRHARGRVEAVAIFTPAILLFLLAAGVFANRLISERAYIPATRRRDVA